MGRSLQFNDRAQPIKQKATKTRIASILNTDGRMHVLRRAVMWETCGERDQTQRGVIIASRLA